MSEFTHVLIILAAIIANIIAIKRYAYDKENEPTCDNYVLNTYLYVLFEFLVISIILVLAYENTEFESLIISIFTSWIGFIIYIVAYIVLFMTLKSLNPKRNQLALYATWMGVVSMFAILMYFPVKLAHILGFLKLAIVLTLVLTSAMSYLGVRYGDDLVKFDWDIYLNMGVFLLILAYFALPFMGLATNTTYIALSCMSLVIFSLLLLSCNKELVQRSKTCYEDNNPNYPMEATEIGIKIINVFSDIVNIIGRSKNNK